MIWYIDSKNGDNTNNGHSIDTPLKDLSGFNYSTNISKLKHGDKVLIKRGSEFNDDINIKPYTRNSSGTFKNQVYIGTYGSGDKPKFSKYKILNKNKLSLFTENIYNVDLSNTDNFTGNPSTDNNIGFIYDKASDTIYGERVFALSDLKENMQFYIDTNTLYIYANNIDIIPSEMYLPINLNLFTCDANLIIDNIEFTLGGAHGVATTADQGNYNIIIKNCDFNKIGGSLLSGTTRYGNGFECYGQGNTISVENCTFEDIYDTGVTIQGVGATFRNISFNHNIFKKCMPCEQWIDNSSYSGSGYINCEFKNNLCMLAGYGFGGKNRQVGYGYILSNLTDATNTEYSIENNIFYKCKDGAYNTIDLNNTNIKFNNNIIYGYKNQKINKYYEFTFENYENYQNILGIDKGSKFIVLDESLKGSLYEENLLISNLFMNDINNIYKNINYDSNDDFNNFNGLEFFDQHARLTIYAKSAILIDKMIIFSIKGKIEGGNIAAYQTLFTLSTPGITIVQQDINNPSSPSQKFYAYPGNNKILIQNYAQLTENADVSISGIISIN